MVLAWDGRLDNADDLRIALRDHAAPPLGDAALAAAAYDRWGHAGLGRLVGDWRVVIRDASRGAVVLASDYAGVRPLYYHHRHNTIRWSGRLEPLVAATSSHALDDAYIHGFLTLDGCPNHTPYDGIHIVPPGDSVEITATGAARHRGWTPPLHDVISYADERRYDEQFLALFEQAVAVRLRTSSPVVAELSGGLDSSSVVCMAVDLIKRGAVPAPRLATVSYVHRDSGDLPFIRDVEAFCGLEGVHLSTHEHPLAAVSRTGSASPEGWAPLQESVAEVARTLDAKVLLTGQNGDLVTGNWFDDSLQVAASLRRGRVGRACREALAWSKVLRVPIAWILWRGMRAALPPSLTPPGLYGDLDLTGHASGEMSLAPAFAARFAGRSERSTDWLNAAPERRKRFRAIAAMRELRVLQALEPVQDLDVTHPFAHRPLVEFLLSVPADVLCRAGEPRRLMRRALGDLLPRRLRARRSKSLFGEPWAEALVPLARTMLADRRWSVVDRGWVDAASLASRLGRLTRGLDCHTAQLRQLILLEFWLRGRAHASGNTAASPAAA